MKNAFFLILIMLTLSHCAKKVTDLSLKDYRSVEGIKIGMPIAEALQVLDKKYYVEKQKLRILDDEPESIEYVVFANKSKKETLFAFNGGHTKKNANNIFRIVLKNPKFNTAEGVHVGMNVKDLKSKAKLKSADFNFQDGLYILSDKFDGGYWMDLDAKKDYKSNYNKPAIKDIPEHLKIKGIVLF